MSSWIDWVCLAIVILCIVAYFLHGIPSMLRVADIILGLDNDE